MKTSVLAALMGICLVAAQASAQQRLIHGKVVDDVGDPLSNVQVAVTGTSRITSTNTAGTYVIPARTGQTLQFRYIGTQPIQRTVGTSDTINVQLRRVAVSLNALTVTALGQSAAERSLGTAQQTVQGSDVAQTQRMNFTDALQGRVAGVQVNPTSGVPGASSKIVLRGISSISSSNQPLFILDGLPMNNNVFSSGLLGSGRPGSSNSFENRDVDFTNRAADINPDDIESIVVLKGPAASALYGIDAANGAIVITTKKGRPGTGGFELNSSTQIETPSRYPEIQQQFDTTACCSSGGYTYFGPQYAAGTRLYDNVKGFFQTGVSTRNNLAFTGASADSRITYRVSASVDRDNGVIPNTKYDRNNITGRSTAQVTSWLGADLSMMYSNSANNQPFNGVSGPLLGLLIWPQTDNAADYLTPAGDRRLIGSQSTYTGSFDNPYFSVNKNKVNSKSHRFISNLGLTVTPFSWGNLKSNIGIDANNNDVLVLRHPESETGATYTSGPGTNGGVLDVASVTTPDLSEQTLFNVNSYSITNNLSISGLVGQSVVDDKSTTVAVTGQSFLDPNFVSINNTAQWIPLTTTTQRRLVSGFGQATLNYHEYLYLTATGRNDWTSTIPKGKNSFFYPSFNTSFVFSDAFPGVAKFVTGKLTAAYAEVGRDAQPYAYIPALQQKTTAYGGFGYDFWGPNPNLKPEWSKNWEFGTQLSFLDDRLGLDATYYSKRTYDEIVQNVRQSYGTGFILFNLNGADTKNAGLELTVNAVPVLHRNFEWDILANFDKAKGKTISLPFNLPELYNSDSWVAGNVRNGTMPGLSTMSLTGYFWRRNNQGKLLIDPSTGLPIAATDFIDAGYDRQPDFTIGLTNTFRYKAVSLNFLLDLRRGGDIYDATDWYLTTHGLSKQTEDRWTPRIVAGVLRDGKENTANPTPNNIVIVPAINTNYYTDMSPEQFIEKNINWLRLADVTLSYTLPQRILSNASVFVTATDLFMLTNYTGLDPLGSASNPNTGGSGSVGIDYGNFGIPRVISVGAKVRF
ncbi:MAG TPA: SusC/RagA family TonB-linked outer membrane protein [Gemmatimonadaceae bacterium]|nr:SusC/RagA family TonB-linked outer membrane protein [Gemmatimonadaceae bacterium]